MAYTALLFDLDHTLLDSDASEALAFQHALSDAGVADPAHHLPRYIAINRALWTRVERGEITPGHLRVERFAQLVAATGIAASPTRLADAYAHGLGVHGELYPGVASLLDALLGHARLSLAIVTNGLSDVVRARVARLDLARYFRVIAVSAELGVAKPDPAIIHHTLAALGTTGPAALMIGDSLTSDMRGGRNAGIATCWYNPARRPVPDLGDLGDLVDHDIADHAGLLPLLA